MHLAHGALTIRVTGHGHLNQIESSGGRSRAERGHVSIMGWIERTSEEAETTEEHADSLTAQLPSLQSNL